MSNQPVSASGPELDQLSINTIRFLSVDAVQKANSGHPGLPMGAAPMAYVLWMNHLKFNPKDPKWFDRDRFILSAGHGSALLYSLLHLTGYDLSLDDLKQFRQMGSRTPGHPESMLTPGVEVTTGPLGQGFGNAVGEAMVEAHLAGKYNTSASSLIDHYTYALVSDGDLMEGVSAEAASLAGHLQLGKLIVLYDDNHISLDGPTSLAFTEDVLKRFEAYGWHTHHVADGNDTAAIDASIHAAKAVRDKPSIIAVRTVIGYGSPLQGTSKVHGSAMGEENVKKSKEFFGWNPELKFFIPEGVSPHMLEPGKKGAALQEKWEKAFADLKETNEAGHKQLTASMSDDLPDGWDEAIPVFKPEDGPLATRQAHGKVLTALKKQIGFIFGGSADLASSNDLPTAGEVSFQPGHYKEDNIWFGVREHGMGAILNGMAAHKGVRVYGATFFNFSDYMKGAIRLAALTEAPVTYVFTHDSIGLGEDGPTHQPIEQLAALRALPNMTVIRPADANETAQAWKVAIHRKKGPVALVLSRQKLPVIDQERFAQAKNLEMGAYILSESDGKPEVILIGTGSEVSLIMEAQLELKKYQIKARVVSMPSWELFEKQDQHYRDQVFPPQLKMRLSVEAAATLGWDRYVTEEGKILGMTRFGESGPGEEVMKAMGFTVDNVVKLVRDMINR